TNVNPPGGTCQQAPVLGPSGADEDVVDPNPRAAVPCYAVSVTALSGGASWQSNTGSHVALFRVLNAGGATDLYSLACTSTAPVNSCALNVTSASLQGAAEVTVAVTYSVGAPASGTVTVTATGGTTGDNAAAAVNVTANAPTRSVIVTPKGQSIPVTAGGTSSVGFQVQNTGSVGDTFALTCIATGSETCSSVTPSVLNNA